ncbi:MAG: cellulase family glycosylhydrolase [Fibrobacterales bacterium]
MNQLLIFATAMILTAIPLFAGPVSDHGDLQVLNKGGNYGYTICDESGNPYQLKGFSALDLKNWDTEWVVGHTIPNIVALTGSNAVRIAMYTYEASHGYMNQDAAGKALYRQKMKDLIQDAILSDIYILIDWHILNDPNPWSTEYYNEAYSFFTEIAQEYGVFDNLLFELGNEPLNVSFSNTIKPWAEHVLSGIRLYSDNLVTVGTPNWSQSVGDVINNQITTNLGRGILYNLHFYAATHDQWLRDAGNTARLNNVPLIISEFGTVDASGSGILDLAESARWLDWADTHNYSWFNWSLSVRNETSAALINNDLAGPWYPSDFSESGRWILQRLGQSFVDHTNIAYGKAAFMNSTHTTYYASKAVDGVVTGYNPELAHSLEGPAEWWMVDLGAAYTVTETQWFNRMDCCSNRMDSYTIQYSLNGSTWTDASVQSVEMAFPTIIPINASARYIRLLMNKEAYINFSEAQVFGSLTPLDEDNDGIVDGSDLCHGTIAGHSVNAHGCAQSQLDDDTDGVMNDGDMCPNTPVGSDVDASGCGIDSDNDGIFDGLDECPSTTEGELVNETGCSLTDDSDGDGVPNVEDQCPETPTGEYANSDGCSVAQLTPPSATYPASSDAGGPGVSGCTGSKNCSGMSGGVDLNGKTGYMLEVAGGDFGGTAKLFARISIPSSSRAMSLWLNNQFVYRISSNSSASPRPSGREFGPFTINLLPGANTLEFRDTEGTAEFDILNVRVEAVPIVFDADTDGVTDQDDQCPNTQPNNPVDAEGCDDNQRDSDDDGFLDRDDLCPNSPANAPVDTDGCADSERDTDRDGVIDLQDQCPNTQTNNPVDVNGCADNQRDNDSDGIMDSDDLCSNTPANATIDTDGCADSERDTDGDGVSDALDQCPGTVAGAFVDEHGCFTFSDEDGDGVADEFDQCLNTPTDEYTNNEGCSIAQLLVPSATYSASSDAGGPGVSGCTGSKNCSGMSGGVDLNGNTGYMLEVAGGDFGGTAELFARISIPSSSRAMSLWLNNQFVYRIASNSSASPRPSGREFGPFTINLLPGTNTVEFRDTEGTAEFDILNVRIEAVPIVFDADTDGVPDAEDSCPGTPTGATVDAVGCPLDEDSDGIFDGLDLCPGTVTTPIDIDGCAAEQKDTDNDGVNDAIDLCPSTDPDVAVDYVGCALPDTDGDGVIDASDLCPSTSTGASVNAAGCEIGPVIEAENFNAGTAFAPFEILSAGGVTFIEWPSTGSYAGTAGDAVTGQAHYTFTASQSNVTLFATVNCSSGANDSFYYKVVGKTNWAVQNNVHTAGFQELNVTTWNNLTPGQEYTLMILRREDGTKLDKFRLNGGMFTLN